MKILDGESWTRQGITFLWSAQRLQPMFNPPELWSLARFVRSCTGPEAPLPSNAGRAVVVAGLDSMIDALGTHATDWVSTEFKHALQQFGRQGMSERAVIFWLANGSNRIAASAIDDTYALIQQPAGSVPFRALLSGAQDGLRRLVKPNTKETDAVGDNWHGLHVRGMS